MSWELAGDELGNFRVALAKVDEMVDAALASDSIAGLAKDGQSAAYCYPITPIRVWERGDDGAGWADADIIAVILRGRNDGRHVATVMATRGSQVHSGHLRVEHVVL
jgi:hypothetical protein